MSSENITAMKKIKLVLLSCLVVVEGYSQSILRVNNTPGVNVPYTTLAAAIAAAGVNDIIMVEGSSTGYGSQTIAKKVTIIGPGYFLSENTGLQSTPGEAIVEDFNLNAGANGSKISGLSFSTGGNININGVSNIEISNNRVGAPLFGGQIGLFGTGSNILVKGNYMRTFYSNGAHTGVIVTNNYVSGQVVVNSGLVNFSNNVCDLSGNAGFVGSVVQNNIFIGFPVSFSSSTYTNNIFGQAAISGADATNVFNVSTSSLFVGLTGNTTDTQWRLKVGSPAIGAGIDGVDCGMYGGATPYKPSGIATGQHTINNLIVPATVTQGQNLNVKVSTKVN